MEGTFNLACVQPPPPLKKNRERIPDFFLGEGAVVYRLHSNVCEWDFESEMYKTQNT